MLPVAGSKRSRSGAGGGPFDPTSPFLLLRLSSVLTEVFSRRIPELGGVCSVLLAKGHAAAAIIEAALPRTTIVVSESPSFAKVAADVGLSPERMALLVAQRGLQVVRAGWLSACLERALGGLDGLEPLKDAWRVSPPPSISAAAAAAAPAAPTAVVVISDSDDDGAAPAPAAPTADRRSAASGPTQPKKQATVAGMFARASAGGGIAAAAEQAPPAGLSPDAPWRAFPAAGLPGSPPVCVVAVPPPELALPPLDGEPRLPPLVEHLSLSVGQWACTTGEAPPAALASAAVAAPRPAEAPAPAQLFKEPMVAIWAHGAAASAAASPEAEDRHVPAILAPHGSTTAQAAIAAAQLALTRGRATALRRLSFASLGQCWVRTSPGCVPRQRVAMFDLDGTLTQSTNGTHFCETADDWEWLPGALETLRALHAGGFKLAVCTNQGVDKPMSVVLGRMTNVARQAEAHGAPLQIFVATAKRGSPDFYRKPAPGVFWLLEALCNGAVRVDRGASVFVGDAAGRPGDHSCVDLFFALNAGVRFSTPEAFLLPALRPGAQPASPPWRAGNPDAYLRALAARLLDLSKGPLMGGGPAASPWTTAELVSAVGASDGATREIVLLVGPACTGKSTLALTALPGHERVNQDTLGTRPACIKAARAALVAGRAVCVDNTNVDPAARAEWVALAREVGVPIRALLVGGGGAALQDHLQALRILSPLGGPGGPTDRRSVPSFVKAQQASKAAAHPVDAAREGFAAAATVPLRPSPVLLSGPAAPAGGLPPACALLAAAESLQASLAASLLCEDARPSGKGQKERALVAAAGAAAGPRK